MKNLIKTAGLILILATPISLYQYREVLNNKVAVTADINKDNSTDRTEWKKVYDELGIHYDELNSKKLGIIECNKYLSKHKK